MIKDDMNKQTYSQLASHEVTRDLEKMQCQNPNKDFIIDMINYAVVAGTICLAAAGIESKHHPIERAYHFLINYINCFN